MVRPHKKKKEVIDTMEDDDEQNDVEDGGDDNDVDMNEEKKEEEDLYDILGIPKDSTDQQIKQAYYKQALKVHPDRNINDPEANRKFQKLGRAYEILSDKQKRGYYDETGSILNDLSFSTKSSQDWYDYWTAMFKKVTTEDLVSFGKSYKYSQEEQNDLKKFYIKYKGDMTLIMESVMLSDENDLERFVHDIRRYINSNELAKYTNFEQSVKKYQSKGIHSKRKAKQHKEAMEAEELLQKIQNKKNNDSNGNNNNNNSNSNSNSNSSLSVPKKQTKQQIDFNLMVQNIKSKYTNKPGQSKKNDYPEPSEEDFLRAREKIDKNAKKFKNQTQINQKRKSPD